MTLREFRMAVLDYSEGLTGVAPVLDSLSEADRPKAYAWLLLLATARGTNPDARRPSTEELIKRARADGE